MKIDNPRVTEYALGELRAAAREEFEKELAQSVELQRELEETAFVCQKLTALPPAEQGLDEMTRANLREECLRNLRIVRREQNFRRAALAGALGALAACLLLVPFIPWTAVLFRPHVRETRQGAGDLVVAVPRAAESTPAPADKLAPVESIPDPASGLPNAQDPNLADSPAQARLGTPAVASAPA
jgi:DNA-binding PucR family transcriptional regulator